MAAALVTPLAMASPLTNKLRFLRDANVSSELEVKVGPTWSTGHIRMAHLLAAASHVPGRLMRQGLHLEFGTRNGEALRWLATAHSNVSWHGFDSFLGLPTMTAADVGTHWKESKYTLREDLLEYS